MQKAALLMYAIDTFQKYKFTHYCMWDIDWKRLFRNVWITVLRIWSISQYLAAPFSNCKAMIDNTVHNSGPYFIWYAPLSLALFCLFLCFASVHFHAPLLLFFLSAVDPDHVLDVHLISEFVTLVWSSVYICFAYQLKLHEILWAITENWFVIGWSIFSSL